MAVAGTQTPNLSPSYEGVMDQLKNTANLNLQTPTIAGAAAGVVNKINDQEQQKALLQYKASLEDSIAAHQSERDFENKGGIKVDENMLQQTEQAAGWPAGTIPRTMLGKKFKDHAEFQGVLLDPVYRKNMQDSLETMAKQYDDAGDPQSKKYANVLRGVAQLPPEKLATVYEQLVKENSPEAMKAKKKFSSTFIDPGTGERMGLTPEGTTESITGPSKRPKPGELVTDVNGLYANEKKALAHAAIETKKSTKPIVERIDKADSLISDIKENSPNTLTNIRAEIANLAGIPGSRMGFQFLKTEGLNQGFAESIDQAFTRASGNQALSASNQQALLDYVKKKRSENVSQLNSAIEDSASGVGAQLTDVHPDLIKAQISADASRYLKDTTEYNSADDVRAAFYSGKLTKDEASSLLKKNFGYK